MEKIDEYYETMQIVSKILTNKNKIISSLEYKNILENKEIFIENFNKLGKQFGLSSSLEIVVLYTYMLHNGLLSKHLKFIKEDKNSVLEETGILETTGCTILTGYGCCRHVTMMLSDILQRNNYGSLNFILHDKGDIDGNKHMVNCIDYNGGNYMFDALNINFLKQAGSNSYSSGEHNYDSYNDMELLKGLNNKGLVIGNFPREIKKVYTDEEFLRINQKFAMNKPLLMSFFMENKNLYDDTCKKLSYISKIIK